MVWRSSVEDLWSIFATLPPRVFLTTPNLFPHALYWLLLIKSRVSLTLFSLLWLFSRFCPLCYSCAKFCPLGMFKYWVTLCTLYTLSEAGWWLCTVPSCWLELYHMTSIATAESGKETVLMDSLQPECFSKKESRNRDRTDNQEWVRQHWRPINGKAIVILLKQKKPKPNPAYG